MFDLFCLFSDEFFGDLPIVEFMNCSHVNDCWIQVNEMIPFILSTIILLIPTSPEIVSSHFTLSYTSLTSSASIRFFRVQSHFTIHIETSLHFSYFVQIVCDFPSNFTTFVIFHLSLTFHRMDFDPQVLPRSFTLVTNAAHRLRVWRKQQQNKIVK